MARAVSAQSRVDDYLRAESRLSSIDKPKMEEGESKSSYCWRLIRQSVRQATDIMKKADIKDLLVTHGVHHDRKLMHPHPVLDMIHNKNTKEYITLDGKMIRIFQHDGRKKDIIAPPDKFERLIHAPQVNLFIGWTPGDNRLFLMNSEFELQSTSKAEGPIQHAIYNEQIGEVLTLGKNFLTNWVFRYGGRHILPRRTSTDGFLPEDDFSTMVLEETASRTQKLFTYVGTTVVVFNVYEGCLLTRRPETHVRAITAMLHFNPLKYLITAAKDGSIKVWDERWHLQLVFVGHGAAVTSLAVYPHGPNILSSSLDSTLRVWSLETCDEVDEIPLERPVKYLSTVVNQDGFCSISDSGADLWKVQHIHHLHTRISHRVLKIKTTSHPEHPVRNVLLCKDSSVRIISPTSGDVLTTLLMSPRSRLVDAAYAIADDTMFAVFGDGKIVKCATNTNPCTVLEEWPCQDPSKACNYLLVYEYVITASLGEDTWGGLHRALAVGGISSPGGEDDPSTAARRRQKKRAANRTLLLGGRRDGQICVYNRDTGDVEFEIEAHGSKGVLSMVANSRADQLISAGYDNIIKIWRLYPYTQESLAPLMSFFCAHCPVYMAVLKTKLVVAFQEPTSATYSTVMYNLQNKDRHDHGPEHDHTDTITGLVACPKMRVLASASVDGTVRIWNEENTLIRIVRLSAVPHSLAFCSEKGDLLIGIGDHVHKISYKHYLPTVYRLKMVTMQFRPQCEENPLPLSEDLLAAMTREDVKRLKAARSSFKFTHFVDILTEAENEEVMREKRVREKAFAELGARDDELTKIRDGNLPATKKPKSTAVTKREAFDKYLDLFYNRTNIKLPDEDLYPKDTVTDTLEGPMKTDVDITFRAEKEPTGFFPDPSTAVPPPTTAKQPTNLTDEISETSFRPDSAAPVKPITPATPIRADGFVPNSVLVRLLWPQDAREADRIKKEEEEERLAAYRPPQLSEEQMAQIAGVQKKDSAWSDDRPSKLRFSKIKNKLTGVKGFEGFRDRTIVLDYDDDESRKDPTEETATSGPSSTMASKEPSSFLSKVQDIMKKSPTPPASPEPVQGAATQDLPPGVSFHPTDPTQDPTGTGTTAGGSSTAADAKQKRVVFKPKAPANFLARPLPPARPRERRPTPPASRSPSPPPPPPEMLPGFITQFRGTEWFDKYFPNCNENTMPKPWSPQAFSVMLARLLRVTDYPQKVDVTDALAAVLDSEGLTDPTPVSTALYNVLHHALHPPTCSDPHQKAFLKSALTLLVALGQRDKALYRELMVQFLEGDRQIRNLCQDLLVSCGLKDPHNYLVKELDGWDVWNLDERTRARDLNNMCDTWLDKWLSMFKIHVADSIERLKKGQNVRGRATAAQLRAQRSRGGAKKQASDTIMEADEETVDDGVTVTFNRSPDADTVDGASYIEAINYFCEVEQERYLDRLRAGESGKNLTDAAPKPDGHKNTVLVLPKIAGKPTLVRLGETHTSKCRPKRETTFEAELRLPPITTRGRVPDPGQLHDFPTAINLPMKAVIMDPFSSHAGRHNVPDYHSQQPVLLMLKTSQKYFVPARSYLQEQETG